jgi:hypothetical protein
VPPNGCLVSIYGRLVPIVHDSGLLKNVAFFFKAGSTGLSQHEGFKPTVHKITSAGVQSVTSIPDSKSYAAVDNQICMLTEILFGLKCCRREKRCRK